MVRRTDRFDPGWGLHVIGWFSTSMTLSRKLSESLTENIEAGLADPYWIAREFGVADVSGDTVRKRANDLAYQLGWEEGRSGRKHGRLNDVLGLAKKNKWKDVLKSYQGGLIDGSG